MQKAKCLSEEALQIAKNSKRQRRKGKTSICMQFQRTARKNKKALLSEQCKEIEENNRMGKTKDLFKKIRATKVISHTNMGTIKDRHGLCLTEVDIKRMWQEYTEELYKKDLNNPDKHDGMITHLEPDMLELKSSGP